MQFTSLSVIATLALASLAAATPTTAPPPTNQCTTGSLQCCATTSTSNDPATANLLGLLGIALGSATGTIGVNCDPLTIIGVSGTSCSEQPVCCTNNSFNGVVALGCTPLNVNV
ncbi:fungal hydrophobin [Pholiota conissans]|uniref:Hydrophobin n=1 Tax=Pholiota conissans TaxID=109636 RepID=A0A9P5Z0D7_9AGAR|nr:fungal hydrophobin [Pholiota conissans]